MLRKMKKKEIIKVSIFKNPKRTVVYGGGTPLGDPFSVV